MFFHAFNPDLQENKQRLNLSEHAYRTLINDASVFLPEDSPKTETGGCPWKKFCPPCTPKRIKKSPSIFCLMPSSLSCSKDVRNDWRRKAMPSLSER